MAVECFLHAYHIINVTSVPGLKGQVSESKKPGAHTLYKLCLGWIWELLKGALSVCIPGESMTEIVRRRCSGLNK